MDYKDIADQTNTVVETATPRVLLGANEWVHIFEIIADGMRLREAEQRQREATKEMARQQLQEYARIQGINLPAEAESEL